MEDISILQTTIRTPSWNPLLKPRTLDSKYLTIKSWWRNFDDYCIGKLSQKTRKIKIINVLSDHEDLIEVPSEETINEIMERYKEINIHASSYTWKRQTKPLDMSKTLEENQIPDEVDEFKE
jgi:hypothetical protein